MKISRAALFAAPLVLVGTQLAARELHPPTAPAFTDATMMIALDYNGGPVVWSVGVNNPTPGALQNVPVDFTSPGAGLQQQKINLAQGQTERVKFTDSTGLNLCSSKDATFSLGTDTNAPLLTMRANATCEFLATPGDNYWLSATNTDFQQTAWQNHGLVAAVKAVNSGTLPWCGGTNGVYMEISGEVHNNTQKAGHGLLLKLQDQNGTIVGTSGAFAMAKGTVANITVALNQPTRSRLQVVLADPEGSLGNASMLSNLGVYANVQPVCHTTQTKL